MFYLITSYCNRAELKRGLEVFKATRSLSIFCNTGAYKELVETRRSFLPLLENFVCTAPLLVKSVTR